MILKESRYRFNQLFKKPVKGSCYHANRTDQQHFDYAWSLYGEFGPVKEISFQNSLRRMYETRTAA